MSQGLVSDSVTWKIGRYDVVGHLASGGMAEILLGRILGPSGFQRPVVIKRILPHLVREQGFVDMFLDEARIVAGIRHPNVVQVHELGHEDDNLFLVMEFLEGEACSGLAKRLRSHEERLEPALAAYIVAEACAGLHAAHELKNESGALLNVVHRDVSPQNVFVTYAGQVKVLDFGIATAADRVTRTETGTFKGKFEYSSPEQCKGRKLDRRSDVFALGVLLFEFATGTRLFKRAGQLDTLRAICEEPMVSPKTIIPDFPDSLERIFYRALERDKDKRYPTAQAMRHDLLAAMRTLSDVVAPEEELGKLMQRLFADRIAEKGALLKRVESGSNVGTLPAVETDSSVEIPMAVDTQSVPPTAGGTERIPVFTSGAPPAFAESASLSNAEMDQLPIAKRSMKPFAIAGAVAAVLLVLIVIVSASKSGPAETVASAASAASSARAPEPAPSATATATAGTTATVAATPTDVVIRIETQPSKAKILLAGEEKGVSPLDLRVPKSSDTIELEIRRDGYQAQREKLVPDADQKLKLTLSPVGVAAPPKPSTGSTTPYKRFD